MTVPFPTTFRKAPGPTRPLLGPLIAPGSDPLAFFLRLSRTYGDVVHFRMQGANAFLVGHPDHIRDVLVTDDRNFTKSRALERAKRLLGEGLLTSEGAAHRANRRLLQPAFHHHRVASYAEQMTAAAARTRDRWRDGETLDVWQEMMRLTLAIVGRTLFSVDIESQADEVGVELTRVLEKFWITLLPFADVIERLPLPSLRRAYRARLRLDALIYRMIANRRASGLDHGDLLSMLLHAQDEERAGLSDRQVRDEAMTLMLAGHETTANALAWTWYLLALSSDAEAALHREIDEVLGGRLPTVADLGALSWTTQVVTESMRLYPPAWMIGRRAIRDYPIGDYLIPAESLVFMSQYVVHRDGRFYENPEKFQPERWTPAFKAQLPKFAYFPFGGGSRQCIGEAFAWMELALLVATIGQSWRLRLEARQQIEPKPLITLRPRHGIRMFATRRGGS